MSETKNRLKAFEEKLKARREERDKRLLARGMDPISRQKLAVAGEKKDSYIISNALKQSRDEKSSEIEAIQLQQLNFNFGKLILDTSHMETK